MPHAALLTAIRKVWKGVHPSHSTAVQEMASLTQRLSAQEHECARAQQQLSHEEERHVRTKEELQELRAEAHDLQAARARDSATVTAAEDLRKQWESMQVGFCKLT